MNPLLLFAIAWGILIVLAALSDPAITAWFTLRRRCGWCGRRLGGNPFAKHETTGMCRSCFAREIKRYREPS